MIPELGLFSLAVAACLALVQAVVPLWGAARADARLMATARPVAQGQFVFVAIAFGCLAWAFVANDFSVAYVAQNSNSLLPVQYRIAGVWGGHEGSILLWVLILTVWTTAVTVFSGNLPEQISARVIGVMGLISLGFLGFLLLVSNPFERLLPAAIDGRDLNPLLQDPGMVFHPPMLYMGYVGFSVAFAFALAALMSGRLDAAWARWSRPWTIVAWIFLTLGIALGSYWAYYELGWGGWWFWDPVENASFMPWLVGTALMHSLAMTEKRGAFKSWTVLLAIFAFSLSLLGTFLVRSGVLTSVHAFATDPKRGLFILTFLAVVIGASLLLYAARVPKVGLGGGFGLISRESLLLTNNVLLTVAAASVLLGTLYPLFLDALGMGKISVGPPYFESVFVPLMTPLVALMGIGPYARWKQADAGELARRLKWALAASLALGLGLPFLMGRFSPMVVLGLMLAAWVMLTNGQLLAERVRGSHASGFLARLRSVPRAAWGMALAHIGIGLFIVGVTLVKGYEVERDVKMRPGETTEAGGYVFRYLGAQEIRGPNYVASRGTLEVTRGGSRIATLNPEKRAYTVSRMPMTEAAIDTGFTRDLYVSMGEPVGGDAWVVQIRVKPFVDWIWVGCLIMALGGGLAASDRRYRLARRAAREPASAAAPARA
ncbi:MAG: c-type cytochrome biogenesis protein CcmF [Betaproteobacteria bacterium CG2_30_68_42]|nr:MAG: c-type cytochrome biogenesis protein CcmF [Betaproteobacteria bacterium CG2_30_68_42]